MLGVKKCFNNLYISTEHQNSHKLGLFIYTFNLKELDNIYPSIDINKLHLKTVSSFKSRVCKMQYVISFLYFYIIVAMNTNKKIVMH